MTAARLEIIALSGAAQVQDLGRRGAMHEAVPPGGALVPELLMASNRAVGNASDAAALECYGRIAVRAQGDLRIALDGEVSNLRDGEACAVVSRDGARVRYVAVRGGIDVPRVLGGRGTLVGAAVGGLDGRWLRRGDVLPIGEPAADARAVSTRIAWDRTAAVRVVWGPDDDEFTASARDTLTRAVFTLGAESDRVGFRLTGAPIARRSPRDGASSRPMVRGAIEVPASGDPIVLGPDHPTTGGYPVIATVIRVDHGALCVRATGARVTFRAVTVDEARDAWRAWQSRWAPATADP